MTIQPKATEHGSKPTAGPWEASGWTVRAKDGTSIAEAAANYCPDLAGQDAEEFAENGPDERTAAANARLIAAAPDLLRAIERLVQIETAARFYLEDVHGNTGVTERFAEARAALRKARNGEG